MDELIAYYKPKLIRVASQMASVLSGPKAKKIVCLQVTWENKTSGVRHDTNFITPSLDSLDLTLEAALLHSFEKFVEISGPTDDERMILDVNFKLILESDRS